MSEEIRRYTAGFCFHSGRVLLVRKTHPKWQAGMMNAVGGTLDPGEDMQTCIRREFHEETGLLIPNWDLFCVERGPGYEVNFYRCTLHASALFKTPKSNDRDEDLEWCDPNNVKYPVLGNLHWLLPLAQDPRPLVSTVETTGDIRKIVTW